MVIRSIAQDSTLVRLTQCLAGSAGVGLTGSAGVVHVSGLWGSSAPMVAAQVAASRGCPLLYITAHLAQSDHARDDFELFLGRRCDIFPAWEALPNEGPARGEIQAERLRLCSRLDTGAADGSEAGIVLIAPIQALMQPVPTREVLERHTLRLCVSSRSNRGESKVDRRKSKVQDPRSKASGRSRRAASTSACLSSPTALLSWLLDRGFNRLDLVESPYDAARRGDIVDIFAPGETTPYRVQFADDEIESIRRFDVGSQRSIASLSSVAITAVPATDSAESTEAISLFRYLPRDTVIVLDEPSEIQELGNTLRSRLDDGEGAGRRQGGSAALFSPDDLLAEANSFQQLHLTRFGGAHADGDESVHLSARSLARFENAAADAVAELCRLANDGTASGPYEIHVYCDSEGELSRLREMIADASSGNPPTIELHVGTLHRGFEWTATKTILVAHHEIFHKVKPNRRLRRVRAVRAIESWTDLAVGDYVVHSLHGIAQYKGLSQLRKGESNQQEEFMTLAFAGGGVVHVPCSQVELVQKYIGAGGRKPELSKLGGKRWSHAKQRVADSVEALAGSLLHVQAVRSEARGTAYPPDTDWQREFESSFPYEETEDQIIVAEELKTDLRHRRPMDRMICGDVGYGKTELAMRAAFKVVEFGRQVAVLVPTTVLAEQHNQTFKDRMAEYPFVIGCLSRFRTPAEQKKIVDATNKGRVDIVIGTHRLLSKDVRFANLGLVIIDEEQRFGVEHKEGLKTLRETVEVLTLTATPIPRSLHMAMMGIRDISSLQTPPVDRRAIATQVHHFDHKLIRNAILRELDRDGQVYFIHNFVQSIASVADTVRSIVPEARVVYGHGQMHAHELEKVMHTFGERKADVLVATTIIESGIDNPNVNTIFINRADRFGLADLHQLRGRVGRSDRRAYCYLLLSPDRPVTAKATKRLKTIEEFSELGAGFRIAMRDLEIRGAGNLLGAEQSGHIAAVGYDMYCRLLNQTVRRMKNEPDPSPPPVHVDLDVASHIPRHYIHSDRARVEAYRRMGACHTTSEIDRLEGDFVDAYGPPPKPVRRLLELATIRICARGFGIKSISLQPPDVVFAIDQLARVEPMMASAPGTVRMPDPKTVHLRLPKGYLEQGTLLAVLRKMLTGVRVEETSQP